MICPQRKRSSNIKLKALLYVTIKQICAPMSITTHIIFALIFLTCSLQILERQNYLSWFHWRFFYVAIAGNDLIILRMEHYILAMKVTGLQIGIHWRNLRDRIYLKLGSLAVHIIKAMWPAIPVVRRNILRSK